MRGAGRILFTLGSFLPLIGVLALSTWTSMRFRGMRFPSDRDLEEAAIVVLLVATAIAFVQIALGIVVALHTSKRKGSWGTASSSFASVAMQAGSSAERISSAR